MDSEETIEEITEEIQAIEIVSDQSDEIIDEQLTNTDDK